MEFHFNYLKKVSCILFIERENKHNYIIILFKMAIENFETNKLRLNLMK